MKNSFVKILREIFLLSVLMFQTSWIFSQGTDQLYVSQPTTNQFLNLRVLVVNNSRLALLNIQDAENILLLAKVIAKKQLDIDISFSKVELKKISEVKSYLSEAEISWIESQRLNLSKSDDIAELKRAMHSELSLNENMSTEVQKYALPHLAKQPTNNSKDAFIEALADTQIQINKKWESQTALDGQPLILADLFNEFSFWQSIGYLPIDYEVVLTNQIIVSSERIGNAVHSALRGGVSNGVTNSSNKSANGAVSVVSTFPFFSRDKTTKTLRGNKSYTKQDSQKYATALLVHELGHQLLHLGHPFNNSNCIMNPPQRLQFDAWYQGLDSNKCLLNSSDAMTPGITVKFSDIR